MPRQPRMEELLMVTQPIKQMAGVCFYKLKSHGVHSASVGTGEGMLAKLGTL